MWRVTVVGKGYLRRILCKVYWTNSFCTWWTAYFYYLLIIFIELLVCIYVHIDKSSFFIVKRWIWKYSSYFSFSIKVVSSQNFGRVNYLVPNSSSKCGSFFRGTFPRYILPLSPSYVSFDHIFIWFTWIWFDFLSESG